MNQENKAPLSIDVLTAQELEKKGNLKFISYAGVNNYIAVFEHKYYALVKDDKKYELLKR